MNAEFFALAFVAALNPKLLADLLLIENRQPRNVLVHAARRFDRGPKLSDEERARISADLSAGKAAVGVLARIEDAPMIQGQLTARGGATSSHDVVDEAALQQAAAQPSA